MVNVSAQSFFGKGTATAVQATDFFGNGSATPVDASGNVDHAVNHMNEQFSPAFHKSKLASLLQEQASGGQQARSSASFFPESLGEAEVNMAKDLGSAATKAGATVEQGLMRPLVGRKIDTTEQISNTPDWLRPYDTKTDAAVGAGKIGLMLAPETTEVKALLGVANDYLKGRTLLGLGGPKAGTATADAVATAKTAMAEKSATDLSGKVLQPSTAKEGARATEGLKLMATNGVKTFEQAVKVGEETITKMSRAVDARLGADPTPRLPGGLPTKDAVFIKAALNDMGTVASKSRSPEDFTRIASIANKFEKDGLTAKEINDVAREYGTTFKDKAFKSDGTPKTTWSGEGYENTRSGLKDAARNLMPDKTTQILDEAMSKVYAAKSHFNDLAKEVMKSKNATIPASTIQKVAKILGHAVKAVSGKVGLSDFLKGVLPQFFSGNETLDAVALEGKLGKLLNQIKNLQGLKGKNLSAELIKMAEEAAGKQTSERAAQPLLESKTVITPEPKGSGAGPVMPQYPKRAEPVIQPKRYPQPKPYSESNQ